MKLKGWQKVLVWIGVLGYWILEPDLIPLIPIDDLIFTLIAAKVTDVFEGLL